MCRKLSELHCKPTLLSNCGEKVMKWRKTVGWICPIVFLAFQSFSPGLENNETSKCGSEFSMHDDIYFVCGKLSELHLDTQGDAGRLFYTVRKFHGPRISELNISMLMITENLFKTKSYKSVHPNINKKTGLKAVHCGCHLAADIATLLADSLLQRLDQEAWAPKV